MSDNHGHGVEHYVRIWKILVVLLVCSVIGPFIGDWIREGGNETLAVVVTLITAFGIAFYKAYLVAKNFMHLNIEKPIVWYFLTTALAFMVLFFAGVSADVMNHTGSNWVNKAAKAEVARGLAAGSGHHGAAGHDEGHGAEGHGAEGHGADGHHDAKDDAGHAVESAEPAKEAGHH
jgi:caa(3)-type oxidase subunit IV